MNPDFIQSRPRALPRVSRRAIRVLLPVASALALAGCADQGTSPGDPPTAAAYTLSADCGVCHPQQLAEWESSMHAYAAADPVMLRMREMVQAEGVQGIGAECFNCHRPGVVRAVAAGVDPTPFADDGLGCDVCHSIDVVPDVANIEFLLNVDPTGPKYGNLDDPQPTEAHASGVRTFYSSSVFCAPCHQVDLENGVGLENTYREWEESVLSGQGIDCQDCHMPAYEGKAATASEETKTLHRHAMVGVDYAYEPFRGIDLDQQKEDIRTLLRNAVRVELDAVPLSVSRGGELSLELRIVNDRTGHSIPSGVSFAREMWVEVSVRDTGTLDEPLYRSGALAANGDLVKDSDLTFFGSQMFDAANQPTLFSWRAASIDESLLLPYEETRIAAYSVPIEQTVIGPLAVEAALRFRPVSPPLIRALGGLDHLLPIEIFEMWSDAWSVDVTR